MPRRAVVRLESFPAAPFYAGFVVAGMATVLLGPILPILSARWSLSDLQAGSLFAVQFAGSTLGAVLASHFRRGCLIFGYASVAAGLAALALDEQWVALPAFALVGVGLGSATTATNLLFGLERPDDRGALLTRVNLFWGVGAVSCPPFIAAAVGPGAYRLVLLVLSVCAACVFAALASLVGQRKMGEFGESSRPERQARLSLPIFLLFSLLLFLYVGGETSISGWIATYVHRFGALSTERSSIFVSVFWLSIVLGRAFTPLARRFMSEFALVATGVVTASIGISTLLFPQSAAITLGSVALTGLGCAPIFPLAVARLLARIGHSRHSGWIFAICGSGGAVLPWAMGLYSGYAGSLRTAFLVPLTAMGGVFVLILAEQALPVARGEVTAIIP